MSQKNKRKPVNRLANNQTSSKEVIVYGENDELVTENMLRTEVFNQLVLQRKFFSQFLETNRKADDHLKTIDEACHYPEDVRTLTVEQYYSLYSGDPIAAKVVDIYPKYCWQVYPDLLEDEELDEETAFEQAFTKMCKNLNGISFYEGVEGNKFWEYLHRVDKLSRIGRYGCLLLGLDDGKELNEPADIVVDEEGKLKPGASERKLLFIRAFDERLAKITTWETDKSSPRYGKPTMYKLTLGEEVPSGTAMTTTSKDVHWTRIVHVVDTFMNSEVLGTPALQVVWKRCLDLYKLYGGSAEMYYHGAFPGLSFETHPSLGDDLEIDGEAMREQINAYQKRLQRYLATKGMTVKSLAPQVVAPTENIDVEIEAICIHIDCPKSIFLGSDDSEASGKQASRNWFSNVRGRQMGHCVPNIIVPTVNQLILLGVLPVPEKFRIAWPDIETSSDTARAEVAVKNTQAMITYVSGDGEAIMDPIDFLVRVLKFSEREAKKILENREANELLRKIPDDNFDGEQVGETPFGAEEKTFVGDKKKAIKQQERTNRQQKTKANLAKLADLQKPK